MYLPVRQAGPLTSNFSVTLRAGSRRGELERDVAEAIRRIDGTLSLAFRDYSDQVGATLAQERLVAILSGIFAALALLLAALGLYGVTAYGISRRRRELAVRLALGATGGGVVRLVLGRVMLLLIAGTAIGTALILWAARFARTLLFQVEPGDPVMIGGAAAFLVAVGLFAGWLPARRVSRMDHPWSEIR